MISGVGCVPGQQGSEDSLGNDLCSGSVSNRLSCMYVAGTAAAAVGEMVCTDLGENTFI